MDNNRTDKVPHSKPISINTSGTHHRYRSGSLSSDSSGGSPSDPIQTPLNPNSPKVATVSPPTSPFFSYIMGQQPGATKTFPLRRSTVDSIGSTGTVFDDGPTLIQIFKFLPVDPKIDDIQEADPTLHKVHRRATTSWTSGPPQPVNQLAGDRHERATGLLRRLSLSTPFSSRPQPGFGNSDHVPSVPPNTALPNSPTNGSPPSNRGNSPPRKPVRRAPSPMGERILKGHFDGFN